MMMSVKEKGFIYPSRMQFALWGIRYNILTTWIIFLPIVLLAFSVELRFQKSPFSVGEQIQTCLHFPKNVSLKHDPCYVFKLVLFPGDQAQLSMMMSVTQQGNQLTTRNPFSLWGITESNCSLIDIKNYLKCQEYSFTKSVKSE